MTLSAQGETCKAIAYDLGNHEKTVVAIRASLRERYEKPSIMEVVIEALRKGDLKLDDISHEMPHLRT